jgi:hypothetical protein
MLNAEFSAANQKLAGFNAVMAPFMTLLEKPGSVWDDEFQKLVQGYDKYSTRSYLTMGTDLNGIPIKSVLGFIIIIVEDH